LGRLKYVRMPPAKRTGIQSDRRSDSASRARDKAATIEGVRKLVTRKYSYLIYYSVYQTAEEIVVFSVKHSARKRVQSDL
jgi:plasmid stabilization system protein ParE